jgi:hypothetical protein
LTENTDVAIAEGRHVAPASPSETRAVMSALYNPDLDFGKLLEASKYFSAGWRLVSKDDLIGVPHIITGVTYRDGYVNEQGVRSDYVSIEAVVANSSVLESTPVKHMLPGELAVYPNEPVIFNDGGTGIRRTLTELFHNIGMVDVGPEVNQENRFDRAFYVWANGAERAQDGMTTDLDGDPFRYVVARGLRKSDYDSPFGPATTYYFG